MHTNSRALWKTLTKKDKNICWKDENIICFRSKIIVYSIQTIYTKINFDYSFNLPPQRLAFLSNISYEFCLYSKTNGQNNIKNVTAIHKCYLRHRPKEYNISLSSAQHPYSVKCCIRLTTCWVLFDAARCCSVLLGAARCCSVLLCLAR